MRGVGVRGVMLSPNDGCWYVEMRRTLTVNRQRYKRKTVKNKLQRCAVGGLGIAAAQ